MIPVFEKILFPFLANRFGIQLSTLQKIGCGFVFSACAMVVAGLIEIQRKDMGSFEYNAHVLPGTARTPTLLLATFWTWKFWCPFLYCSLYSAYIDQDIHLSYKDSDAPHCSSHCCNPNHLTNNTMITCTDDMVTYGCHCLMVCCIYWLHYIYFLSLWYFFFFLMHPDSYVPRLRRSQCSLVVLTNQCQECQCGCKACNIFWLVWAKSSQALQATSFFTTTFQKKWKGSIY
jgi:hypothetical protein